jgi:hypothetical protein
MVKCALVCGAGGFIGGHLVKRLKCDGLWVRGVDLKFHEFSETEADDFVVGDLRDQNFCRAIVDRRFDEVYQLAADMGGAGYIFTGEHDAGLMHNSATINLNILDASQAWHQKDLLFILRLHVSGLQPGRSAQPKVLRGFGVSGGAGWRRRVGKAVHQRAPVFGLSTESRNADIYRATAARLSKRCLPIKA